MTPTQRKMIGKAINLLDKHVGCCLFGSMPNEAYAEAIILLKTSMKRAKPKKACVTPCWMAEQGSEHCKDRK